MMEPSVTEIELVVAEMFEQSKTDASISEYIQYYPALIERVKSLTEACEKAVAEAVHSDGYIKGTRILRKALGEK